jgi:hypothetical protein
MKTKNHSIQIISILIILLLLSGCAPAGASTPVEVQGVNEVVEEPTSPAAMEVPATPPPLVIPESPMPLSVAQGSSDGYQPVSAEVCQILQEAATQSLGLTFMMEEGMPFIDYVTSETGWSCTLISETNGAFISDPNEALAKLVTGFMGWTEQTAYAAGGPTGAATAMTRDSGLILISVGWEPSADVSCPADQPISACPMPPEKKLYTIKIEAAQK